MSERKEKFIATGEVVKFEGFLHVYKESNDEEPSDDKADESRLPALETGETLLLKESDATQRFTQQPPRYTEAMLVRKLEELGIGRPSTYAPTISTIQNRDYVEKGEKTGEKHRICTLSLSGGTIKESFKNRILRQRKKQIDTYRRGHGRKRLFARIFPRHHGLQLHGQRGGKIRPYRGRRIEMER